MVHNVVNYINSWLEWFDYTQRVRNTELYKYGWFVYCDRLNEDGTFTKVLLCHSVTENEARTIFNNSKYPETCIENLFEPITNHPSLYESLSGFHDNQAFKIHEISVAVHQKFLNLGLYD